MGGDGGAGTGRGVAVPGRRLLLVRHGRTEWTAERRYCGWTDLPLVPEGRIDVALAARRVAGLLAGRSPTGVWTSDLRRCRETAHLLSGPGWPRAVVDHRLRELDFGRMEGRTFDDLDLELQEALLSGDDAAFAAPDGESVEEMSARVARALAAIGPGTHVVVTHGGVIRLVSGWSGHTEDVPAGGVVDLPF